MTAFTEIPVRFPGADGAAVLAGTLALPPGEHDCPLAVLVSGTGPIDRDVTIVGHAVFRVLAHQLADAGIASLRFDKRGVGKSEGDFHSAGPADFAADVLGALEYAVGERHFAVERVGLIGHSEGGMVALTAAAGNPETAFCVLMSTPLLSGKKNLARSFALLARGGVARDDTFDGYVSALETLVAVARSETPAAPDAEHLEIASRLSPLIFNDTTKVILGTNALSGPDFIKLLASPCLDTSLAWEPARIVPDVTCPVLVIYGEKDVQAPAVENLAEARALTERLGRSDWELLEMAGMNHGFQRCRTGMPDEYAGIDHVMAPEVVAEVGDWIRSKIQG